MAVLDQGDEVLYKEFLEWKKAEKETLFKEFLIWKRTNKKAIKEFPGTKINSADRVGM
jgi:hypothetical protein